MGNLIFQPNVKPKKEYSLPKETKEYAYYDFDDTRTLLDLPSKFQNTLRGILSSDPIGYNTVFEDVMEEWMDATQDCLSAAKVTEVLEKKYSFPRGQLKEFARLRSNDTSRNKFYFPSDRNKRKNLTKDIRTIILDRHPALKEVEKILNKANEEKKRFSIAPDAEKKHCPKYVFEKSYPLVLVAMALEEMTRKSRGQTAHYDVIIKQILKLNSGFNIVTDSKQTICLPLRGESANLTHNINNFIDQNLRGKCFIADGKYDMRPVMIAMERLGYLPSNFKGQDGPKRLAILQEINGSCDLNKPKRGSLIYFGVDLGQSKSHQIQSYLKTHLSGINLYTAPKGDESLASNFQKKYKALERWIIKNEGKIPDKPKSFGRSNERQYLMWFAWKLSKDLTELNNQSYEQYNDKKVIWDHGNYQDTINAAKAMAIKFEVLGVASVAAPGTSNHRHGTAADFIIKNFPSIVTINKGDLPSEFQSLFDPLLDEQHSWRSDKRLPELSFLHLDWAVEPRVSQEKVHTYYWVNEDKQTSETVGADKVDVLQYKNLKTLLENLFGLDKHQKSTNHWTEA